MHYTIKYSILILCAKYQEAGLCGSREKRHRNYLVSKFAYVHNIRSRGQTGSGHAADSKLLYTIQFSILMLYAKYEEAGLCGSRDKRDRNFLVSKFAYVHNIESCVKQVSTCPRFKNVLQDTDSKMCDRIQLHTDARLLSSCSRPKGFFEKM